MIGLYSGSFNPWHKGHEDVVQKALKIFDKVIIATGYNKNKKDIPQEIPEEIQKKLKFNFPGAINFISYSDLLVNLIYRMHDIDAIIKGLRNQNDFQYEMIQQYWNEDLGLKIPIIYFIADRKLTHISSSAIRKYNEK